VQALLETLNIPYTGSGPLSSIRCMDKDYAKRALRAAGIQTPPFRTFLRRAMNEMGASAALDVAAGAMKADEGGVWCDLHQRPCGRVLYVERVNVVAETFEGVLDAPARNEGDVALHRVPTAQNGHASHFTLTFRA
jgi:hypothetical protein